MNNKALWILIVILVIVGVVLLLRPDESSTNSEGEGSIIEGEMVSEEAPSSDTSESASESAAASSQPTTESVATSPASANATTYDENGKVIVRYTSRGFVPQTVEIQPGDAVVFVNDNILPLWVKAQAHPTAEYFEYASLNQGHSAYKGEEYVFTFTQPGSWGYANLNKESHQGVVIVSQ